MITPERNHALKAAHMQQRYRLRSARYTRAARRQWVIAWWMMHLYLRPRLKRGLDILVASIALLVFMPIMALIAIAVKLESPGPVLFRQQRTGRWGTLFTCYKFRSMHTDAERRLEALRALNEADGPVFKMKADPRVTNVGRFIRKTSLDELPQLWNVLCGTMSLVGPRPALPQEVRQYTIDDRQRLGVIPGITGLQQVSGRSDINFARWVELDVQYIMEQGVRKDIAILLKTIPAVLFSRGAY